MFKFIIVLICLVYSIGLIHSLNFCGDWTQYKDIKCVKVLKEKTTEEEALTKCQELDESSSLISINDQDEQHFLNNLLRNFSNFSINAWIGIKYNGVEYDWTDGTDSNFTNWSEYAVRDGEAPCVHMSLVTGLLGQWFDISCRRPALVVCQKRQELSLNSLKNVIQSLSDTIENQQATIERQQTKNQILQERLESMSSRMVADMTKDNEIEEDNDQVQNAIPIGFLYNQLPKQSSPQQLWPNMEWTEITRQYAGLFFRAEGNTTEPFGQIQQANQSRITSVRGKCSVSLDPDDKHHLGDLGEPSNLRMDSYDGIGCRLEEAALNALLYYTSSNEVRPINTAIKLWKRTG